MIWLQQNSLNALLKPNRLEKARLHERFSAGDESRRYLEQQIRFCLEESSAELEHQQNILRNLLRLYALEKGCPARLLWDAWDTLCLFYSDEADINNAPLFREFGARLWAREWEWMLEQAGRGIVEPSRAGRESQLQLKRILAGPESEFHSLLVDAENRTRQVLNAPQAVERFIELIRGRREEAFILKVVELLCRPGQDNAPWCLKITSEALRGMGSRSDVLWRSLWQQLISRDEVAEAFYSWVATKMEGIKTSEREPQVRDMPARFALNLLNGPASMVEEAQDLLSTQEFRNLLDRSPSGHAVLQIHQHRFSVPLPSNVAAKSVSAHNSQGSDSASSELQTAFDECKAALDQKLLAKWASSRWYAEPFSNDFGKLFEEIGNGNQSITDIDAQLKLFDVDTWIRQTRDSYSRQKKKIYDADEQEKLAIRKAFEAIIDKLSRLNHLRGRYNASLNDSLNMATKRLNDLEALRQGILENPQIPDDLCRQLTGQPSASPSTTSNSPTAREGESDDLPLPPNLILRPGFLKVPPILLQVEEGNTPEHFLQFQRSLLEYHAGHRTWESVGFEALCANHFHNAIMCLLEAQKAGDPVPRLSRAIQDRWKEQLKSANQQVETAIKERDQLRQRGMTEDELSELNGWQEQLQLSLQQLPSETSGDFFDRVKALGKNPLVDVESYLDFVADSLRICQATLQKRQEQERKRLLQLKREIDDLANAFQLAEAPLSEKQLLGLQTLQQHGSDALRNRNVQGLEKIQRWLKEAERDPGELETSALAHLESPVARNLLSAGTVGLLTPRQVASSATPEPLDRLPSHPFVADKPTLRPTVDRWKVLPNRFRRELEEHRTKLLAKVPTGADAGVSEWKGEKATPFRMSDRELMNQAHNEAARCLDTLEGLAPLAVWLACRAWDTLTKATIEHAVDLFTESASLFALDALEIADRERWLEKTLKLLLLSLRYRYAEKKLDSESLTSAPAQEMRMILLDLEQVSLTNQLAYPLLQLGIHRSEHVVLRHLEPWLTRRPLIVMSLIETVLEDAALLARAFRPDSGSDRAWSLTLAPSAAIRISTTILERMEWLDREEIRKIHRRLENLEQQLRLRPSFKRVQRLLTELVHDIYLDLNAEESGSEAVAAFGRSLKAMLDMIKLRSVEKPYLTHRLLTPKCFVSDDTILILELHYHRGFGTLIDIRTEAVLVDADDRAIANALEPSPTITRLKVGGIKEIPLRLSGSTEDLARAKAVKITQTTRNWDLSTVPIEIRNQLLTIHLEPARLRVQEKLNPFVVGRPIQEAELIFGRDEQVEQIRQSLMGTHQDQVVFVLGERRSGKTTLLNALQRDSIIAQRYRVFDIDFEHISESESSEQLFRDRLAAPLQRFLDRTGVTEIDLTAFSFGASPTQAFREFMDEVDARLRGRNLRLLFIIDEIERLFELIERRDAKEASSTPNKGEMGFGREVLAGLRDVVQKMERVSFVLAGVTPIVRRFTSKRADRLFKMAIEVECKELSVEGARSLITEPIKEIYQLIPAAVDWIIRETGRQPYLIQTVSHALFNQMVRQRLEVVTRSHLNQVIDVEILPNRRFFTYLSDDIKEPGDFEIVLAMAQLQRGNVAIPLVDLHRWMKRSDSRISADELFERLKNLEQNAAQAVERRVGTRDEFRLKVGLYARHLRLLAKEREL